MFEQAEKGIDTLRKNGLSQAGSGKARKAEASTLIVKSATPLEEQTNVGRITRARAKQMEADKWKGNS
jgi:hypothetical protein